MSGIGKGKSKKATTPLDIIKQRVCLYMINNNLKPEKLRKLLEEKEFTTVADKFCTSADTRLLIVAWNRTEFIVAYNEIPVNTSEMIHNSQNKKKSVIFFKTNSIALTTENFNSNVSSIEITSNPLSNLNLLTRNVFMPLLKREENRNQWSSDLSRKILLEFNQYLSDLYVIVGQAQNQTLLPYPPSILYDDKMNEHQRITILETFVGQWMKQIKSAITRSPSVLFENNGNPDPMNELTFWKQKSEDLKSIEEQLKHENIQRVLALLTQEKDANNLEHNQIEMLADFQQLFTEVTVKMNEATDNLCFLSSLKKEFEILRDALEFEQIEHVFKPLMQKMILVWKHSSNYNTIERLQIIIQQINNAIINQASKYISGEEIFHCLDDEHADEAMLKLQNTINVCLVFKKTFLDAKVLARKILVDNEMVMDSWQKASIESMFKRFDIFLERCQDVMSFTLTVQQFTKIEKIFIGGTQGKELTEQIRDIWDKFQTNVTKFKVASYDMMDINAHEFDADFYEFRRNIKDLEKRLAIILCKSFADLNTMHSRFQLLDGFEGLLSRPILKDEFEHEKHLLISSFMSELKLLNIEFNACKKHPPIHANLPPMAGSISWSRQFKKRIMPNMSKLESILGTDEDKSSMVEVQHEYQTFIHIIDNFEADKIEEWKAEIHDTSDECLMKSILVNNDDECTIGVNFDPSLKKLLREARYFEKYKIEIPEKALNIHQRSAQYQNQTCQLTLIVNKYNTMILNLCPEEKPLLNEYILKINDLLQPAFNASLMNWKSKNVDKFIIDIQQEMNSVYRIYDTMKSSVLKMKLLLIEFSEQPLIERKSKPISVDEFEENFEKLLKQRMLILCSINDEIHDLMDNIHTCLTTVSLGDPKWKKYIYFVEQNILQELTKIIENSLDWMIDQINDDDGNALLEVQLSLFGNDIRFTTHLDVRQTRNRTLNMNKSQKTVWQRMQSWILSFFKIGEIICKMNNSDFKPDLLDMGCIKIKIQQFHDLLSVNEEKCLEYQELFSEFEHLYTNDRTRNFKEFLQTFSNLDVSKIPSLERFQEKIQYYKEIEKSISVKQTPVTINWLKIDAQPLKTALQTWISKWSHTYTSFLKSNLSHTINTLYDFMSSVNIGLNTEVIAGDLQGLKFVLGLIHEVRIRQEQTLNMFEPLIRTVKFLRNNDVEIDDKYIKLLENAPLKWESTVDKVYQAKERVNPLQNEQVDNIKKKVWEFHDEVSDFRQNFRDRAPFTYDVDVGNSSAKAGQQLVNHAYQKMMFYHQKIAEKESAAHELNQLANLFELQSNKYRQLHDCRQENRNLKQLWDMIALVQNLFQSWRLTLWNDINTELLLLEVNKVYKRINCMDKEIRGWKGFQSLQESVKMYQTVLPLVNLLHSHTMKDRHWKQLMKVTDTSFVMGSSFSLGDMLDLGLHKFVDDVEEVVETSSKEAKIEQQLQKMNELWIGSDAQQFEFGSHADTNVCLVRVPEEVLINLEESMSILQGIKGQGKYVQHFVGLVTDWEQKLGVTETVITDWLLVQNKWSSLQSIFVGSEDIREQLPDDSARFDTINNNFLDLMKIANEQPIVCESCNIEGRAQLLESLKSNLELCEKSLNQYLDTKKMAFPRFYFLSNVALLDLLSNGNNPQKVQIHMGDCFDNIKFLKFSETHPTHAIGMYSKDGGEYVPFYKPHVCEGAVEDWLNGLVECMRQTLRELLSKAKFLADQWELEKARHEWVYDYCAQICLTVSQIIWTEETDSQFEALEDGNETAMKDFQKVCVQRLQDLIGLVLGAKLNKSDRVKIMTLITVDVHNRDVIQMLIDNKIQSPQEFAWQAQMRYGWDNNALKCVVNVADWAGDYCFEYIGNTGRLVITPLTDRCYITLTQALRLMMGGAPAGPAGTGKTETTKDLGRACGIPVYVFNCSEQMNVMSLGNIFKGLCQTGAWGCFDEFNRIAIEVLSVVATQVGSFLNALRANRDSFDLMGSNIKLVSSVGVFITMNPGYAGRTELPENLKALFRSCAMVVPDMELICENMLMSEGFLQARPLAHKFITLYSLSKELLSQQMHYDWGLRATKAVLRVAGSLKRAEPKVKEALILMRALRDFNLPKIVFQDQPIFSRLITDLFCGMEIARKVSPSLNDAIVKVTKESGLQTEDMFVRKVTELAELFEVRHSVFVIGTANSGKSEVWRMLAKAYNEMGSKCVQEIMNPKAVKNDELYGWLSASTGDWYDGILSTLMRNMSRCEGGYTESQKVKWLVLDGDIDPEWIESLNTVMDDNKVLTLVSNERIPLTASMRLLFEVSHLKNATPATVSRAGILFINESDVGWKPMIDSWIDAREEDEHFRSTLRSLFNKYVTVELLDYLRKNFEYIVPMTDIQKLQTLCYLLQGILPTIAFENALKSAVADGGDGPQPAEDMGEIMEKHFLYAMIWAFGGSLLVDETCNAKLEFSNWWKHTYQVISYPFDQDIGDNKSNTVFDYFYDEMKNDIIRWDTKVQAYCAPSMMSSETDSLLVNSIMVQTDETVRLMHYTNICQQHANPVLYIGTSGTGKTAMLKAYLKSLNADEYMSAVINLNSYTDATALRDVMQQYVDKKSGRNYGPPGGRKLIYYIDDLNMPYVDTYGTQSPIALIRQHMDYGLWYDTSESDPNRKKKFIHDCQYLASFNQKAGSFTVNERLMAHFATFSVCIPARNQMINIYKSILDGHLSAFSEEIFVSKLSSSATLATIDILTTMSTSAKFRPSSTKFHYSFTLRDLSNVFQGLVTSKPNTLTDIEFIRLWYHECLRVFGDRLVDQSDVDAFQEIMSNMSKKHFSDFDQASINEQPLLFTKFASNYVTLSDEDSKDALKVASNEDRKGAYVPVTNYEDLSKCLENYLADFNENNAEMALVLFEMAVNHIVRIARIIGNPRGNALLVGVGGSGKQSLTRLASWICSYEVFQIQVTRLYSSQDLLDDIRSLYMKAGVKGQGISFMITDSQIVDEKWLVYINDLLSSGDIPGLFGEDEKDGIYSSLRSEAKLNGVNPDSRTAMQEFFISRVQRNLHVVLCFSPVGDIFRIRCRKFPALINCTSLDWFFSWPYDALCSVASRFLGESEELADILTDECRDKIAHHMSHVHLSVNAMSNKYYTVAKRYNYTTPKSFLELIEFYKKLFKQQSDHLYEQIQRLDKGIATLQKTAKDVSSLKEELIKKLEMVEEKKLAANALIERCGKERIKVDAEKEIALKEQAKANIVLKTANAIKADCEVVLRKAMPALKAAATAVECLTKASLTELKALKKPDDRILDVTKCVLILKDHEKKNFTWKRSQAMMKNVDAFKRELEQFNAKDIDPLLLKKVKPVLNQSFFTVEIMMKVSQAAANLCAWVIATVQYNEIYKDVAPKMAAAEKAEGQYDDAMAILKKNEEQVAQKEALLKKVTDELQEAIDEKNRVEEDARMCLERLKLAERLVGGLADENSRWTEGVNQLQQKQNTLIGDVLLSAAFVSYIGAFNQQFRKELWEKHWLSDIIEKEIPISASIADLTLSPKDVLTTVSQQAKWANEGLPVDNISIENAAIVTLCSRWPLMIDPQQQGIKWIKNRCKDLKIVNMNQPRWLSTMIRAVEGGHTVLIENVSENIDPSIDPILSRSIIRKGRSMRIKIAGEEKDYDPKFQLYLQTKLSNPHYKPEIFAQCTLINFIVTESGLEEQLLALVVNDEKPELEETKRLLMRSINEYMVKLNDLENELLFKLSNAPDDILSDVSLIEGLENTKKASKEIGEKVAQAKEKEIEINIARNQYRPVAEEASWIYFLLIQLNAIDHMYQYSLDAFISFFYKAMIKAPMNDDIKTRVLNLRNEIRFVVFTWVSRGLFEKHKLIFSSQLTFLLMAKKALGDDKILKSSFFSFLIFGQKKFGVSNECQGWMPDSAWNGLCKLSDLPGLERFLSDLVASPNRFKEWYLKQAPESNPLPLDWRKLDENDPFAKLCVVRCLRPDRMTVAVQNFVCKTLPNGKLFTELDSGKSFHEVLLASLEDSNNKTPIFFILSPGADPVQTVYNVANKNGLVDAGKYHRVAMGQGQDVIAMKKLDIAYINGDWVVLENIHLMPKWCKELEKKLDEFDSDPQTHEDFRLFLSADPSDEIPIGILERSIKLTNEPPQGMKANLKRAFASFPKEEFDFRESQVKQIQFALCWFHAVMIERKKFGPKGWNACYPFNTGDLVNSGTILVNKLESGGSLSKIPWTDLQYIFGEIMYGGHITDDWDRLLCMTYLRYYMRDELFDDGEMNLIPFMTGDNAKLKFPAPPALPYDEYFNFIDEYLVSETPYVFGLHPNTEIAVRTSESNALFEAIIELQPKDGSSSSSGQNPSQRAASILEEILEKISDFSFDTEEILNNLSIEERGPYQYVFIQECDRMDKLINEMKRSLKELDLGLNGELTMSERMEKLQNSLFFERVPDTWSKLAFPSLRNLPSWIENLIARTNQLQMFVDSPSTIPCVVNVSYLFNPQSFLTAVMQVTARKNNLELDKLSIITEVTRKSELDIDEPARDGAYITGMNLEGAKWNMSSGILDDSEPREMFSPLPVVNCKCILSEKMEKKGIFMCPVYQTQQRGPTFVFQAPLRTKQDPDKWVLGGVVIIMDYVD